MYSNTVRCSVWLCCLALSGFTGLGAARGGDLTDAGDLSIPVSIAKPAPPKPSNDLPSPAPLYAAVTHLLHDYYPKAIKIEIKGNSLHAEYKVRMYDVAQTNTVEPGPQWSGIWLNMELKPGPYKGVEDVPRMLNQYDGPYKVLIMAPESKALGCHVSTRLAFPLDVNPDFLARLKTTINEFEKLLVASK